MPEIPDYWQAVLAEEDEEAQDAAWLCPEGAQRPEVDGSMVVAAYVTLAALFGLGALCAGMLVLVLRTAG